MSNSTDKIVLECPTNRIGASVRHELKDANIEFVNVFTNETDPVLHDPKSAYPYKGPKKIKEYINSQKKSTSN